MGVREFFFLSLFGEQVIATCVARFLLGQGQEYEGDYESVSHGRKINMTKFVFFLCGHFKENEIRAMRSSPFMLANGLAIRMLADGGNIWDSSSHPPLQEFCNLYKTSYAALPTNSQFTERGVKESGYVSLGRRNEKNRTVLATARACLVPEAMSKGQRVVGKNDKNKQRLVQGKIRAQVLMETAEKHQAQLDNLKQRDGSSFERTYSLVVKNLTSDAIQFKKERIEKKVREYKEKEATTTQRGQRTSQTTTRYELTPLLEGKIQYHKMKRDHNIEQVRLECQARGLQFDHRTNWTSLLKLIKGDEKDNKFFKPKTNYDNFKWNETHYGE